MDHENDTKLQSNQFIFEILFEGGGGGGGGVKFYIDCVPNLCCQECIMSARVVAEGSW